MCKSQAFSIRQLCVHIWMACSHLWYLLEKFRLTGFLKFLPCSSSLILCISFFNFGLPLVTIAMVYYQGLHVKSAACGFYSWTYKHCKQFSLLEVNKSFITRLQKRKSYTMRFAMHINGPLRACSNLEISNSIRDIKQQKPKNMHDSVSKIVLFWWLSDHVIGVHYVLSKIFSLFLFYKNG